MVNRSHIIYQKSSTIRKIKQEQSSQQMQLSKENPILALVGMKYWHPDDSVIHEIAVDKFMVSYPAQRVAFISSSDEQTKLLSFHAIGSLDQKIRWPNRRSRHIFLYEAVINAGKAQFPKLYVTNWRHYHLHLPDHMWQL